MTRPAQSMPDPDAPPSVLVKTFLRPYTYRQLTAHAATRGITLDVLLSRLADASLHPVKKPSARRVAADHDEQIRELNGQGLNDSEIGRRLGFSNSAISIRREAMGLPKRTTQGRKKAS